MKSIFVNKDSQLRCGFKILLVLVATILSIILLSSIYSTILRIIFGSKLPNSEWITVIEKVILDGSFILIPFIFLKVFDKKSLAEIGLIGIKKGYKDFIFGLLFGSISISIVFAILINCGSSFLVNSFSTPKVSPSLITGLIMLILVGFGEEVFFRGYLMTILNQTKNRWIAVIVSSLIFSSMHAANPNIKSLALINIFLLGSLLGFMFLKSANI